MVNADGSGRTRLTRNNVDDVEPVWTPGGHRIAFTRWVGGTNAEIYVMRADGRRVRRLTSNSATDHHPDWSSTGRLAFVRSHASGRSVLLVADGNTRSALVRSNRPLGPPVWSPDGQRIAFDLWDGNDSELYVVSADGTGLRRLTRNRVDDYGPVWAPGSARLAFTRVRNGNDIWTTRLDGSGKRELAGSASNEAVSDWAR